MNNNQWQKETDRLHRRFRGLVIERIYHRPVTTEVGQQREEEITAAWKAWREHKDTRSES